MFGAADASNGLVVSLRRCLQQLRVRSGSHLDHLVLSFNNPAPKSSIFPRQTKHVRPKSLKCSHLLSINCFQSLQWLELAGGLEKDAVVPVDLLGKVVRDVPKLFCCITDLIGKRRRSHHAGSRRGSKRRRASAQGSGHEAVGEATEKQHACEDGHAGGLPHGVSHAEPSKSQEEPHRDSLSQRRLSSGPIRNQP